MIKRIEIIDTIDAKRNKHVKRVRHVEGYELKSWLKN